MLYHIKRRHEIKRSIFIRQTLCGAMLDLCQAARPTELERFSRHVNPFGNAEPGEHLKVCARAATYVQNARTSLANLAADFCDESGNDSSSPDKPPVHAFDLVGDRIDLRLHFARERA